MTCTAKDRDDLARARATLEALEAKETAAVGVASAVMLCAGLRLADSYGIDWPDICRDHAKAIRDALEPFDDGERMPEPARCTDRPV